MEQPVVDDTVVVNKRRIKGKGKIKACLGCRKNHKKCDGQRPCSYCVKRNVECLENEKRKASGRPKMTEEEKKQNKAKKQKIKEMNKEIICEYCNKLQEMGARFCCECGEKLPENLATRNVELLRELELMRKKNEELTRMMELKSLNSSDKMWIVQKLIIPIDDKIYHPAPSQILAASPGFLQFLGYESLNHIFFPDLVPSSHHRMLDKGEIKIRVERVPNLPHPKVSGCYESMLLKHARGHFVNVKINFIGFHDMLTKLPSICLSVIDKVWDTHIPHDRLPPVSLPIISEIMYSVNSLESNPEMLKLGYDEKNPSNFNYTDSPNNSNKQSDDTGTNGKTVLVYNTQFDTNIFGFGDNFDLENIFSNF